MAPSDSPEVLFYRIEQCQEVQIIGKVLFTTEQIVANAVRILLGSTLLPNKEIDVWDALTIKTWATLKTFFQATYGHRLTLLSLQSMSGQNGYANQNCTTSLKASMTTPTMIQSRQSHPSPPLQPLQWLLLAR